MPSSKQVRDPLSVERVKDRFLGTESLLHYLSLIEPLTRDG